MRTGRRALDDALALAQRACLPATGEQLAGTPPGVWSSSPACAALGWSCLARGTVALSALSRAMSTAPRTARS